MRPADLPRFPARAADAHKSSSGRVLLVGGSRGMAGAIGLAGMACLRTGTGLVTVATPLVDLPTVASFCPSYMTFPLPVDDEGRAGDGTIAALEKPLAKADAVGLGPGLGESDGVTALVAHLYKTAKQPLVVDADGLNALATLSDGLPSPGGPRVLTPHPGEFRRLMPSAKGETTDALVDDAVAFARRAGVVVLLKGVRTLVTDGTRQVRNVSGGPALATGGTGDVLTGMIASLLGRGLSPFDAAALAAYLHGRAGERLGERIGPVGGTSADLLDDIPAVIAADLADRPGN